MRRLRTALARVLCPVPEEEWKVFQVDDGELHWFGAPSLGDALNMHLSTTGNYPQPAREGNGFRERILLGDEYTFKVYAPEEVLTITYDHWDDVPNNLLPPDLRERTGVPAKAIALAEDWARYAREQWKMLPADGRTSREGFHIRATFLGSTAF
jgi:hypothetical protein